MNNVKARRTKDKIFSFSVKILAVATVLPLFAILLYILKGGIEVINIKLLTSLPKPPGEPGGGILNGLIGTLILVALASAFAIPTGLWAGVFLSENRESPLAKFLSVSLDVLQSTPSIVIGIVVYLWVVVPMKHFSALAGSIALAIMMLPIVVKTTEETLKMVPDYLKEAAFALGATYRKVILKVVLPAGATGIISGILVGIARIAGETAPLLFTAFGNPHLNFNILKPIEALPLTIFNYATSPYEEWHKIAWGASIVLVSMVLAINLFTRLVSRKWRVRL